MRRLVPALVALCLAGSAFAAERLDPTKLPLGDGKYTTSGPKKGYVHS